MRSTSKTKNRNKRPITSLLVAVFVLLLGGAGIFAYMHYHKNPAQTAATKATADITNTNPAGTVDYSPSSGNDNTANNNRKSSPTPATTLDNSSSTTANTTLSAQIVSAIVSSSNLHVGTLVSGATSGTCTLTASQSGQQTLSLATASVQQDVNSYDCGPINIATSKFPTGGVWELTLTFTSGSQSTSASSTVTISND